MSMSYRYVETLGFNVFSDKLSIIPIESNGCKVISTISPNSYGITLKEREFKNALKSTDYLVLDGVYFAFASILLKGKNIKRNQGPDVFNHFMQRLNEKGMKAFFLGSSEDTLARIKVQAGKQYPNIDIDSFSPPFKSEFSAGENNTMVQKINNFQPDVIFVGMTCPKQEIWAFRHREIINASLMVCIGNVFDWFAGTQKAVHPVWYKLRLGWFIRILLRPEVFKRNIGNQIRFFSDVLLIFIKLKKYD